MFVVGHERGNICAAALFGATVGVATSWLKGSRAGFLGDAALGAGVGTFVALLGRGFQDWSEAKGDERLRAAPTGPALAAQVLTPPSGSLVGLAPYPFYRSSLSYPWSEH